MEGMLGNGDVKQSSDESRIASRSAGISSHLHDDHGNWCCRDLIKSLDLTETGLETGRLCGGWRFAYADDVVLIAASVSAAETMVSESDRKTERGLD